jgi:cytochrome c biogenesis protein CcmG/thiol:disulfide interchange protein DsbE
VRRLALPILATLAGAALLGLLVYGVSRQAASRTLDESVAIGSRPAAPSAERSLPRLLGSGEGSLAAYRGRVVVLNFWASWCVPCQSEAPLLEHAQRELERHGGTVLGVSYLDASPDALKFVHENRLTYPDLRDVDGSFAHAYGTDQLPETFVLDRQGRIVAIRRGQVEAPFLTKALRLAESS